MYKLLVNCSKEVLEQEVNKLMDSNHAWHLYGNPFVYIHSNGPRFCQALTRGKKLTISTRKLKSTISREHELPKTILGVPLTGTCSLETNQ